MLPSHYITEFIMIFTIAFLVNRHFQLTHENEALQECCQRKDKCQSPQVDRACPRMQSSTMPGLLKTSSPSSLSSSQEHGIYWIDGTTVSESHQHEEGTQNQSADTLISSSFPPDLVVNPSETRTAESNHLEREISKSGFEERDAELLIPETERIIMDSNTMMETPEKTIFHVLEDSEPSVISSISSSISNEDLPLHTSTSLPTVNVMKEESLEKEENYYTLPVEQTFLTRGSSDDRLKTSVDISLLTSENEIFVQKNLDKLDIPETSIHSNIIKADTYTKVTYSMPLPSSSSSTNILKSDDLMPVSAEAVNENDLDDNTSESIIRNNFPQSPLRPYPSHPEISKADSETSEQPHEVELQSIISNRNTESISRGSSAKCIGHENGRKHCVFRNICYNAVKKDFIFFKGPDSIVESDSKLNVKDLFTLSLSTLWEHNAMTFSVITLPVKVFSSFNVSVISKKSIAITRFKPDNIMHVLHDDVVPLYNSLRHFNFPQKAGRFDAVIVFTDTYDDGDYHDLYKTLSHVKPLTFTDFNLFNKIICFTDIHIGLLTSTIWYQYGFDKPQGPLPTIDMKASYHIQEAAHYLAEHLKSDCFQCQQKNSLVLLSRKDSRLILNEGELILALSRATRLKVLSVSLETQSLREIISIVRSSQGIIGMHGSLLSVAIFLPPGGVLIELYPFAVNPSRYTPFKSFMELPGSHLTYKSWVNLDRGKSFSHPDWLPREGGIHHLPKEVQKEIESQTEVPEHLCCDDPSWLYHIYQDTQVDISAVVSLTLQALKSHHSSTSPQTHPLESVPNVPGPVENLLCERSLVKDSEKMFTVSWKPHWAFKYLSSPQKLRHEIVLQQKGSDKSIVTTVNVDVLSYTFDFDSREDADAIVYNVWITVTGNGGIRSQSQFVSCK